MIPNSMGLTQSTIEKQVLPEVILILVSNITVLENLLWNVEKRSNETFRIVIYWGRRNLQFHSSIVAPLSHFNALSTVAMVKMSCTYRDGCGRWDITFPFIVCCNLACFQTELLCECFQWRAKEIKVAARNQHLHVTVNWLILTCSQLRNDYSRRSHDLNFSSAPLDCASVWK